jgi:hypothetical protein
VLAAVCLAAGPAAAQDRERPLPLSGFVTMFTDIRATSAQKELGLPEGTWYEGTITVSDVELVKAQGPEPARVEIKDWNYVGGCTMLLFRSADTANALKLGVGDQAVVRARLAGTDAHVTRFPTSCQTHVGVFVDTEILTIHKPTN